MKRYAKNGRVARRPARVKLKVKHFKPNNYDVAKLLGHPVGMKTFLLAMAAMKSTHLLDADPPVPQFDSGVEHHARQTVPYSGEMETERRHAAVVSGLSASD